MAAHAALLTVGLTPRLALEAVAGLAPHWAASAEDLCAAIATCCTPPAPLRQRRGA